MKTYIKHCSYLFFGVFYFPPLCHTDLNVLLNLLGRVLQLFNAKAFEDTPKDCGSLGPGVCRVAFHQPGPVTARTKPWPSFNGWRRGDLRAWLPKSWGDAKTIHQAFEGHSMGIAGLKYVKIKNLKPTWIYFNGIDGDVHDDHHWLMLMIQSWCRQGPSSRIMAQETLSSTWDSRFRPRLCARSISDGNESHELWR